MNWQVLISPEAEGDVRNIYRYIATNLLSPQTAKKQVQRIISEIKTLSQFPMRNPVVKRGVWEKRGLRQLIVDNFIVFYLPNERTNEVVVFRVFYNRRNVENILS